MAVKVEYFTDIDQQPDMFSEGPFVMVNALGQWRIECQMVGGHCPVMPSSSIYDLLRIEGIHYAKSSDELAVGRTVDWLNARVKEGVITLRNNRIWGVW
jgi:hypothetical protein